MQDPLLPLSEAALGTPYSAEYLSLRARTGKLKARKIEDVWHVRKNDLDAYVKQYVSSRGIPAEPLIPLSEAALITPYSAEYLSLRARTGKLKAKKVNGVWHAKKGDLDAYVKKYEEEGREAKENIVEEKLSSAVRQFENIGCKNNICKK